MASLRRSLVGSLAIGLAACSYYDSSLLNPTSTTGGEGGSGGASGQPSGGAAGARPGGAAGASAGAGGSAAGATGEAGYGGETREVNGLVKPVGPPKTKPTKTDGVDLVLALKAIDFGEQSNAYKQYGFDLDGANTQSPGGDDPTCKGYSSKASDYNDNEGGRDNAFGQLVTSISKFLTDFQSSHFNDNVADGTFSILLHVENYNGERNDDQVTLSWLVGDNFPKGKKPAFDGTDSWPIQDTSYLDDGKSPPTARYSDVNAYVTDGVLVGSLPGGKITTPSFTLELTAPLLVATLRAPDTTSPLWRIESGTIAARWPTKTLFSQIGRFKDPFGGTDKPICRNSVSYAGIKSSICAAADISSSVLDIQPNIPCSALSMALRVQAVQAKVGPTVATASKPILCDQGQSPEGDDCDQP